MPGYSRNVDYPSAFVNDEGLRVAAFVGRPIAAEELIPARHATGASPTTVRPPLRLSGNTVCTLN
jgi:hypothetical protein